MYAVDLLYVPGHVHLAMCLASPCLHTSLLWPIATVIGFYVVPYMFGEQEAFSTYRAVVFHPALMVPCYVFG